MKTELVIFDLAGTIVDHGCLSVFEAFKLFCKDNYIHVPDTTIKKWTGLSKLEHLRQICRDVSCESKGISEEDIRKLYEKFVPILLDKVNEHSVLVDGFLDVVEYLRLAGIKIGTTTGHEEKASDIVYDRMKEQGFEADCHVSVDEVPNGRPAPWMIHEVMRELNVWSIGGVIKVGDTAVDMMAGRNAGCKRLGVVKSSSLVGLSADEWKGLSDRDRCIHIEEASDIYYGAGANNVIVSIIELLKHIVD